MTTLKDIAERAGVNVSTASRALNGRKGISEEVRARICSIADELNYTPNLSARIMVGKHSRIIGFVVPEIVSNYFARITSELERQLQDQGYSVMIVNSQFKREKEIEALNNFCKYSVDGIFLACTVHQDVLDQFKPILRDKNIPLVLLEARLHSDDYNYIMIDDEAGMVQAIAYLLKKGYKRIGFMSEYVTDVMRNAMFVSAIRKNGLDPADNPIYTHPTKRFEEAGYELMQQILRDPNRPRAFLAGYDDMAIGAIRAAEEAGFSVPRDFAIIGNDNIREAPFLHTSLSTLSPPIERMVELGVRMMLDCIREHDLDSIHRVTLKPELILREST